MKRIISTLLVCVPLVGCVVAMASCSKVSESYAEKINKAAEKDEHYTVDKVLDDLGDEAIDDFYSSLLKSGIIIAVKGCENYDEIEDKWDDGKEVKGIVITIAGGKAIKAEYRVITDKDK